MDSADARTSPAWLGWDQAESCFPKATTREQLRKRPAIRCTRRPGPGRLPRWKARRGRCRKPRISNSKLQKSSKLRTSKLQPGPPSGGQRLRHYRLGVMRRLEIEVSLKFEI